VIRDASGTAVENLTANTPYQGSVHVGSRGSDAAASGGPAHVQVLHRSAGDLAHWEKGQWTLLDSRNQAVPHGSSTWVGPFSFTPAVAGGQALLARVTMPGDRSTIFVGGSGDVEPLLPCALSAPIDQLVPFDNNLAYGVWQAA
jgi:hypothetical protein